MICKGCRRPILWVRTTKGKGMPVDLTTFTFRLVPASDATEEERSGPKHALVKGDGTVVVGWEIPMWRSTRGAAVSGRVSHYATCPNAPAFKQGAE